MYIQDAVYTFFLGFGQYPGPQRGFRIFVTLFAAGVLTRSHIDPAESQRVSTLCCDVGVLQHYMVSWELMVVSWEFMVDLMGFNGIYPLVI